MEAKGRSRSYTVSFCVTRTDPDGVDNSLMSFTGGLKLLDILLLLGLVTVFVLEPLGIYFMLSHHKGGGLFAEACRPNDNVVLVPVDGGEPRTAEVEDRQDVITPLNARDPSALVMSP